jgi:hypothetical protein
VNKVVFWWFLAFVSSADVDRVRCNRNDDSNVENLRQMIIDNRNGMFDELDYRSP